MTWECEWRHAPEACTEDLGGFEKSQWLETGGPKKKGDCRLLAEALRRVRACWGGGDGKASIERLCLSPYVEKPLNSKVIKSFVPELRSGKCFSCFGIPMFYVYMLWTFYVRFTYPYVTFISLLRFNPYVCRATFLPPTVHTSRATFFPFFAFVQ